MNRVALSFRIAIGIALIALHAMGSFVHRAWGHEHRPVCCAPVYETTSTETLGHQCSNHPNCTLCEFLASIVPALLVTQPATVAAPILYGDRLLTLPANSLAAQPDFSTGGARAPPC